VKFCEIRVKKSQNQQHWYKRRKNYSYEICAARFGVSIRLVANVENLEAEDVGDCAYAEEEQRQIFSVEAEAARVDMRRLVLEHDEKAAVDCEQEDQIVVHCATYA
jgi:hypothetical protein